MMNEEMTEDHPALKRILEVFEKRVEKELQEKARNEKRIREKVMEAFENDGFFMVYQSKVDVKSLGLCGYEALIRMKEPGIYPGQFIPVIEKIGC